MMIQSLEFIPGRELSRRFYWEAVRPLLDQHFPALPHAAALLGPGSEVLGFDTEMSMDHDWYPNVLIFLNETDAALKPSIHAMLAQCLPHDFHGFPVDSDATPDDPGTHVMTRRTIGPVQHHAHPVTLRSFVRKWLAWDIDAPLEPVDWLTFPSQVLRSLTAGAVHFDGPGELTAFRQRLAWYPQDVWLYMLAAGWLRIAEEEHLMPRAGFVGDELGSAVIAARLAHDIMSLCFLMARQYAPYPKWFGTAFRQLACSAEMSPLLWAVLRAESWRDRESALCKAVEALARGHNRLGLTAALPEVASNFFGRPFKIIHGDGFANALLASIHDPAVRRIAERGLIGSIDQFSDNTKLRSEIAWRERIKGLLTS